MISFMRICWDFFPGKKKKNLRAIYLKNSPGDRQEKQTEKQIYKTSHGVSKPSDCSSFSSKSLKTMVHY